MSTPTFSVVIPTRDRPQLLSRAIGSVLRQTEDDFELVVVDDGSSVPARPAEATDGRVRLLRRDRSGGAASARNEGWRAARGELVVFLDDDDELLPPFLAVAREAFTRAGPEVGFGWTGAALTREGEETPFVRYPAWEPRFASREEAYRAFLVTRYVGASGLVVRRRVLEEMKGFDEGMTRAEDTDLLIRLARAYDFTTVEGCLKVIHAHGGPRLTVHGLETARSYELLLEKNLPAIRESRSLRHAFHYKLGWLYAHAGRGAESRRHLVAAIRSAPWRLRPWLLLVFGWLLRERLVPAHRAISRWKQSLGRRTS